LSPTSAEAWHAVGAIALFAALGAVLAVALGALLRHAAAVITLLLLLPYVIEPLLGNAPRVGEHLGPFMPFANAYAFTGVPWVAVYPPTWGALASMMYFTGVVAVVFAAAVLVINRRDP
jgi:hypothetical protein